MQISLKAARVNAGLKFREAAELLGITGATLAKYEAGKTFPTVPLIYKMEEVYHIPFEAMDFLRNQNTTMR